MNDIINYYVNLLIIQYHNRPNARETIRIIIEQLLADGVFFAIRDAYDIDTAVGVQLDLLGKYQDIDRNYRGQTLTGFFSFINYDEVDAPPSERIGFSNYTDFETKEGRWLNYDSAISNDLVLPDEDFRVLVKLRTIQNHSNHSHSSIDNAIFQSFGTSVRPDSLGDMIMDYFVEGAFSPLAQVAFQKGALPKPIGVRIGYFIEQVQPFFGFTTYSGDATGDNTGFSTYADFDTKEGETLRYLKLLEA